ncbi:MAG: L-lactate dehydrogenase (quinone) large subunit LdhH [Nitrospirota bacterium]
MIKEFKQSVDAALQNHNLSDILDRWNYPASRAKAYAGIDIEALRDRIAEIKSTAATKLDALAEQFTQSATAKGAVVFRAKTPQAVLDYITNLCKERNVTRVVKSKSMASEEIHLNSHLAHHGIQADETDLGEWIVQLAKQRPSHMVMPALHLTRQEVSDLFSTAVRRELSHEISELVDVARKELREKFLTAEMGITGANIAVAETGSLVIVTNEGNARLVTTLPPIHVAIVGIEKLIENFEDISPILTALPKSATSQLLTSYVSIITGPIPNTDGTQKELHIILLDNKRTEMARDPKFRQALQCIRCGSCLNVCPVFRLVGGHVFGHIYTGGIGTILTAWFHAWEKTKNLQGLCIGCGTCKEVCPGKVDIPGLLLEMRRRLAAKEGLPFIQKTALQIINNRPIFHAMLRTAALLQKPIVRDGFIRHLPLFLSGLSEHRSLPSIAIVPFREVFKTIKQPASKTKVIFFAGCAIEFVFPEIGEAVVKILNKAGIEVLFPEGQSCCGIPHWGSGAFDLASLAAERNLEHLLRTDATHIITACATCATALKKEWIHVLTEQNKKHLVSKAEDLASKTMMFSEYVHFLLEEKKLLIKDTPEYPTLTYHDSCHARQQGICKTPRSALQKCGYQLKELQEQNACCGMGGAYTIKQPALSMRMLKRKLNNIINTEADYVSAECPGCLIQIRGGLDKLHSKTRAKHPAELILERLR